MKKLLILIISLLPIMGFGQSEKVDLTQIIPNDPQVRTGTLENGIKYYIRHNSKDPKRANFHIVYGVGAVQEADNQIGLAHFLEHMAFNGSKNFPDNTLIDYLQSIGVKYGENLNAGTGREMTTYMVTNVPLLRESIVDSVLLVLHDWAGFIDLDEKEIDKERGVISEEWRLYMGDAGFRINQKQLPTIFNNSIYAKRNLLGNEELLKSFTYDDLRSFYRQWYRPDMQAFVIVGDFDVDHMEAKLKATMADIKAPDSKTKKSVVTVDDNQTPLVNISTDPEFIGTVTTLIFRHTPTDPEQADRLATYKRGIVSAIVSEIISERLSDISKKESAPFLDAGVSYFNYVEPFDAFYVNVQSKDNEALTGLEAVYTELLRMQRGGFTASELERAKQNMASNAERQYNNRNDRRNAEFVNEYIEHFINNKPYPSAEDDLAIFMILLSDITLDEVNSTASSYVRDKNSALMISAPSSSNVPDSIQVIASLEKVKSSNIEAFTEEIRSSALIDTSAIKPGKIVSEAKGIQESTVWKLSNGVQVVLNPTNFKADEVIIKGTQRGGLSLIGDIEDLIAMSFHPYFQGNAGLSDFTNSELKKLLTGKMVSVNIGFGNREMFVNGSSTPKDLETALQLIYLTMTAPRFEQSDLNVVKEQNKAILSNYVKTPNFAMQKKVSEIMNLKDPRAMETLPTTELVDRASLDRMERCYKEQTSNVNGMTFVVTGSFDTEAIRPLIEKYIGSLPSKAEAAQYGKHEIPLAKGVIDERFSNPMETPKVTALVVYNGEMNWNTPERLNIAAIGHILRERYTKTIREEQGGTYSIGALASVRQLPEPKCVLQISFETDSSKIDKLLPLVYKEIESIIADGVTPENLKMFKEFSTKKFEDDKRQNGAWTGYLNEFYLYGNNYYQEYAQALGGVTSETIRETAKRLFTQGNVATIVQLPE